MDRKYYATNSTQCPSYFAKRKHGKGDRVTDAGHERHGDKSNRYCTIDPQGTAASWAAPPTKDVHGADGA